MPPPARTYPKGVWFQPKRLASGVTVRYGYWGRGPGTVALGLEGTPEFHERLAEALRHEPAADTVKHLIWRYLQSPEFAALQPRSKSDYRQQLDKIEARFGPLKLRLMDSPAIANHIFGWRDSMSSTPRRADYAVQVLKLLLSWAVARGILERNRAAGIKRLYKANRSDKSWSEDQVEAFMKVAPLAMRQALTLALETGQRQGDLLALPWSAFDGETIRLCQKKTKMPVTVPASRALRDMLNRIDRGTSTTILTTSHGLPWGQRGNGFRSAWREACEKAGVRGVTFHDLRGTFVSRRLAAGWIREEVAMCTGHSLRDLAMLDTYTDRETVADASAARINKRSLGGEG